MWTLGKEERNICPEDFQSILTQVGGLNIYDQPNFRIIWGQTEVFRCANYTEYTYMLVGMGEPCWILQQWNAPEVYGTPESYYVANYDDATGMQLLGEYPYSGKYETLFPLRWRGLVDGKLVLESMPLNSMLLNTITPIMVMARNILNGKTEASKRELERRYREQQKETEHKDQALQIEAAMHGARMAFDGNPVSYARQGCRTSIIDRKVDQMSRHWDHAVNLIRARGRGLTQTGDPNARS